MFQSLFVLNVGIVFLCIVTHTRGEQSRVFTTNETFQWFDARRKCTLLTNERHLSVFTSGLGWTNYSAKYLPWVEYLGCFQFRNVTRLYGLEKQVTEGEQLQECMVHCNGSQFFGLQESTCICLHNPNLKDLYGYIVKPCDTNVVTCLEDPFAFCGTEGGRQFLSVYQKASVNIDDRYKSLTGNCLKFDNRNRWSIKADICSKELYPICYDEVHKMFNPGQNTKSDWKDAFKSCTIGNLASFSAVMGKINQIKLSANFWLAVTRRWTQIKDVEGYPDFCVAGRIKQNGDVERSIRRCNNPLPALCVDVRKSSADAPSETSPTLSLGTTSSSRIKNTSSSLQSITFKDLTRSTYSDSLSTFSSQFVVTTPALKKATSRSKVVDRRITFSSQFVSTTPLKKIPTGRSKVVQETTPSFPYLKEITYPVLVESKSPDLPGKDGISVILIIAIVAATILVIIVILVTIVLCRRKRNTQVPISNESLAMVGKEVVYAQVNKPNVKREQSTSSPKPQSAVSDDTYDHMDHRRLSQTHNPTESNYDTMRSIANAGEEENNYDHVIGTKNEPKRFVVENYNHVEVEFQGVKDIELE